MQYIRVEDCQRARYELANIHEARQALATEISAMLFRDNVTNNRLTPREAQRMDELIGLYRNLEESINKLVADLVAVEIAVERYGKEDAENADKS